MSGQLILQHGIATDPDFASFRSGRTVSGVQTEKECYAWNPEIDIQMCGRMVVLLQFEKTTETTGGEGGAQVAPPRSGGVNLREATAVMQYLCLDDGLGMDSSSSSGLWTNIGLETRE